MTTTEDLKNEARVIALTLSPQDAKALVDGKILKLRHAYKPTLEVRLGTPLGDLVAKLVEKDVAPRGYAISSLNVGNRGSLWQAHLDVDHPLSDNSEAGAIAACEQHRAAVQIELLRELAKHFDAKADLSYDDMHTAYANVVEDLEQRIRELQST